MILHVTELDAARAILAAMLEGDLDDANTYRRQLDASELVRHETGCAIQVDRSKVEAAPRTGPGRADVLAEAEGHGKLWLRLHVYDGYLDDLELENHNRFPDPMTVKTLSR